MLMHMSSACPRGRTSGQPGGYVGEYKGMDWILCPWGGENSRQKGGWGIRKFCKIADGNHGDTTGIYHFHQPINTGNIKWRKGEISDDHLIGGEYIATRFV